MYRTQALQRITLLLLTALLTACGGSGDDQAAGGGGAALTSVSSGVAVDPYIVNAQFEEVSADGETLLQRSSSLTDSQGRFTFPEAISENSIIRLKASQKGLHGNAPYAGMLKRRVSMNDNGAVVVSPLTTLAANGMPPGEIVDMLARAGLPGLIENDVFADPMAGLADRVDGINDDMLDQLQANMAANCYMEILGDFHYDGISTAAVNLDMADMVSVVKQTLNPDLFGQLAIELGPDFNAGDLIHTAAQLNRTIVAQVRQEMVEGTLDMTVDRIGQIVSGTMGDAVAIAQEVHQARMAGGANGNPDPEPTPDPDTPPSGEELYTAECQGCHGSLQTSNISNRTAAGVQAAIDGNAGGMGEIVLTGEEIQLIVGSLPVPEPPPAQPPQYRNGQAVYDQECSGCHRLGGHDTEGNSDLAAMGGTIVAKLEGGHMGIDLPSQELNALADFADTFSPPQPPVIPRDSQTVYEDNCAGCHKLYGYDASGSLDLAGMGSAAAAKVPAGHGGTVSTDELTALAAWLDSWSPAPPPVVDRAGQTVYDDNCAGCHKLYGYDGSGGLDLASKGSVTVTKLSGTHGGTVTDGEISNVADWLDSWIPAPPPVVDRSGETVYNQNCAVCHKLYGYDASGDLDLASKGSSALTRLAGDHGGTMTSGEVTNVASWLDTWAPEPPPVVARDGETVYQENCATCHKLYGYDANGNVDLASMGDATINKLASDHGGSVLDQEILNLADWLDTWAPAPPPVMDRDGQTVYNDECAVCHKLYGYDTSGGFDLASLGDTASAKLANGHGGSVTAGETVNLAAWLDTWSPAPPPVVDRDGQTVYNDDCAVCHKLYGYDTSGSIDLASLGDTASAKLANGHGGSVTAGETVNLAAWLDTWSPAPPPVVDRDGQTVYNDDCAVCHKLYGYDTSGSIDLASLGDTASTKLANGHGGSVTAGETVNLATWLDTWAPAPPPVVTRNGETVYNDNCAGCHKVNGFDGSGSIDLAGQGDLVAGKLTTGHGGTVSADEQTNLVNWLNTFEASDPYAGACDSCHGQPPTGSSFPDTAGAHAVHVDLSGIGGNCSACHADASHNDAVDLGFQAVWDAKSGAALGNGDGTCSNISCHGGIKTPDWNSGFINADTQCRSCHTAGTNQYIGYDSGMHDKHVRDKKLSCTACHDTARLRNGHFGNLNTRTFEQAPSATLRSSLSYSEGRCGTVSCHDNGERW